MPLSIRTITARRCTNKSCSARSERVPVHVTSCATCGRPLEPIRRIDPYMAALYGGAGFLVVALLTTLSILAWRTHVARVEADLLDRAATAFESSLVGADRSRVESLAREVQARFELSDEQRRQVVERSREAIGRLPEALTDERAAQLDRQLRESLRDGVESVAEAEALDRIIDRERVDPAAARRHLDETRGRLEQARKRLARGHELARRRSYSEAQEEFRRATEIDPADATAWADLGAADAVLGQTSEAETCYRRALELDPASWLAGYNLGLLAARKGQLSDAFDHFEQALESLPHDSPERRQVVRELLSDPELGKVRQDPRFAELVSGSSGGGR